MKLQTKAVEYPWATKLTMAVKTSDINHNTQQVVALPNSSAMMSGMNLWVVQKFNWAIQPVSQYIRVLDLNANETVNKSEEIKYECWLLIRCGSHVEWVHFIVFKTGNSDMIIRHNWL